MNIKLNHITKQYEGRTALNNVDLLIEQGSFCGIVGPNGAGKSTLLNIIAGLVLPTEGSVLYGEELKEGIPYQEMTMVFQSPYLIRTTAEKNMAYPLKLRNWSEQQISERLDQLITELGLSEQRKQKAWTLSAGEMQKVALARALSFHPRLLLLDEPTANIDPATTEELEKMLLKINREEGTTILLVTHNLAQAKRLCDTVIFLYDGSVVESGDREKLLKSPEQKLTQQFIQGEWLT
jgi:tungstate transport system ATP-binding protein